MAGVNFDFLMSEDPPSPSAASQITSNPYERAVIPEYSSDEYEEHFRAFVEGEDGDDFSSAPKPVIAASHIPKPPKSLQKKKHIPAPSLDEEDLDADENEGDEENEEKETSRTDLFPFGHFTFDFTSSPPSPTHASPSGAGSGAGSDSASGSAFTETKANEIISQNAEKERKSLFTMFTNIISNPLSRINAGFKSRTEKNKNQRYISDRTKLVRGYVNMINTQITLMNNFSAMQKKIQDAVENQIKEYDAEQQGVFNKIKGQTAKQVAFFTSFSKLEKIAKDVASDRDLLNNRDPHIVHDSFGTCIKDAAEYLEQIQRLSQTSPAGELTKETDTFIDEYNNLTGLEASFSFAYTECVENKEVLEQRFADIRTKFATTETTFNEQINAFYQKVDAFIKKTVALVSNSHQSWMNSFNSIQSQINSSDLINTNDKDQLQAKFQLILQKIAKIKEELDALNVRKDVGQVKPLSSLAKILSEDNLEKAGRMKPAWSDLRKSINENTVHLTKLMVETNERINSLNKMAQDKEKELNAVLNRNLADLFAQLDNHTKNTASNANLADAQFQRINNEFKQYRDITATIRKELNTILEKSDTTEEKIITRASNSIEISLALLPPITKNIENEFVTFNVALQRATDSFKEYQSALNEIGKLAKKNRQDNKSVHPSQLVDEQKLKEYSDQNQVFEVQIERLTAYSKRQASEDSSDSKLSRVVYDNLKHRYNEKAKQHIANLKNLGEFNRILAELTDKMISRHTNFTRMTALGKEITSGRESSMERHQTILESIKKIGDEKVSLYINDLTLKYEQLKANAAKVFENIKKYLVQNTNCQETKRDIVHLMGQFGVVIGKIANTVVVVGNSESGNVNLYQYVQLNAASVNKSIVSLATSDQDQSVEYDNVKSIETTITLGLDTTEELINVINNPLDAEKDEEKKEDEKKEDENDEEKKENPPSIEELLKNAQDVVPLFLEAKRTPLLTSSFKLPLLLPANFVSIVSGLILPDPTWNEWKQGASAFIDFFERRISFITEFYSEALVQFTREKLYFDALYQQYIAFWLSVMEPSKQFIDLSQIEEKHPDQFVIKSPMALDHDRHLFGMRMAAPPGSFFHGKHRNKKDAIKYSKQQALYFSYAASAKVSFQGFTEWTNAKFFTPSIAAIYYHFATRAAKTKNQQTMDVTTNALYMMLISLINLTRIHPAKFFPMRIYDGISNHIKWLQENKMEVDLSLLLNDHVKFASVYGEYITKLNKTRKKQLPYTIHLAQDQFKSLHFAVACYNDLAKKLMSKATLREQFTEFNLYFNNPKCFYQTASVMDQKAFNNLKLRADYNGKEIIPSSFEIIQKGNKNAVVSFTKEGVRQDLQERLQMALNDTEQTLMTSREKANSGSGSDSGSNSIVALAKYFLHVNSKEFLTPRSSDLIRELNKQIKVNLNTLTKSSNEELQKWLAQLEPGKVVKYLHPGEWDREQDAVDLGQRDKYISTGRVFLYIPYAPFVWLEEGMWASRPGKQYASEFLIQVPLENLIRASLTSLSSSMSSSSDVMTTLALVSKMRQFIQKDEIYEYAEAFVTKYANMMKESEEEEKEEEEEEKETEDLTTDLAKLKIKAPGGGGENDPDNLYQGGMTKFERVLSTKYDKIMSAWNQTGRTELKALLPFMMDHKRASSPDSQWFNVFINKNIANSILADFSDMMGIIPDGATKLRYLSQYNEPLFRYALAHLRTGSFVTIADRESNWQPVVAKLTNLDQGFEEYAKQTLEDEGSISQITVSATIYRASDSTTERKVSPALIVEWLSPIFKLQTTQINDLKNDLFELHQQGARVNDSRPGASLHGILNKSLFNRNLSQFEALLKQMHGRIKSDKDHQITELGTIVNFAHPTLETIVQGEVVWPSDFTNANASVSSESKGKGKNHLAFDITKRAVYVQRLNVGESESVIRNPTYPIKQLDIYSVPIVCIVKWVDLEAIIGADDTAEDSSLDTTVKGIVGDFVSKSIVTHLL